LYQSKNESGREIGERQGKTIKVANDDTFGINPPRGRRNVVKARPICAASKRKSNRDEEEGEGVRGIKKIGTMTG